MRTINFYDYYGINLVLSVRFFYKKESEENFIISIKMTEFQYHEIMGGIPKTEEGFYVGLAADYITGIWEFSSGEMFELETSVLNIEQLTISKSKMTDETGIMACTALIDMFKKSIKEDGKIFIIYDA